MLVQANDRSQMERRGFVILGVLVLAYGFLSGFRTVTDYDLGWQLATGRWIVEHHQVPSTDVLSYTAAGQPWIYPVGAELLLYGVFIIGGYWLLSLLGAVTCAGTVALLLRRASVFAIPLALIAAPRVAARTTPRAEMFTTILFAAFLSILWQFFETGEAPLWVLPGLMVLWVNLHLGFAAGLALVGGYIGLEGLELIFAGDRRTRAIERFRRALPWLVLVPVATLVNPWGWKLYSALARQSAAMSLHSQIIAEWTSVRVNWTTLAAGLSIREVSGPSVLLIVAGALTAMRAFSQLQVGAAALLLGASYLGMRHARLQALAACVIVVIGGKVLCRAWSALSRQIPDRRLKTALGSAGVAAFAVLLVFRCSEVVSGSYYRNSTDLGSFGLGLSWWFPERAAEFIEREHVPGEILHTYDSGGFVAWRLGRYYPDYVDGRAIPFGKERIDRLNLLLQSPSSSEEWQREADRYGINTILIPLGRFDGVQFFPVLRDFCSSAAWRPVYMDEVSAVFVRSGPKSSPLLQRFAVDCQTVALPAGGGRGSRDFNAWANAAALLAALGRDSDALAAANEGLAIDPRSAFLHFTKANLSLKSGDMPSAAAEIQTAVALYPSEATWSGLARLEESRGNAPAAIAALHESAEYSPRPYSAYFNIASMQLRNRQPREALQSLQAAEAALPDDIDGANRNYFAANVAHMRSVAWRMLGDVGKAVAYDEEASRLIPQRPEIWNELAILYGMQNRAEDAGRAKQTAEAISSDSATASK
jgi:hypothetical protein